MLLAFFKYTHVNIYRAVTEINALDWKERVVDLIVDDIIEDVLRVCLLVGLDFGDQSCFTVELIKSFGFQFSEYSNEGCAIAGHGCDCVEIDSGFGAGAWAHRMGDD